MSRKVEAVEAITPPHATSRLLDRDGRAGARIVAYATTVPMPISNAGGRLAAITVERRGNRTGAPYKPPPLADGYVRHTQ